MHAHLEFCNLQLHTTYIIYTLNKQFVMPMGFSTEVHATYTKNKWKIFNFTYQSLKHDIKYNLKTQAGSQHTNYELICRS